MLARLPYKHGAMASRKWGHGRHSICSFASKMKPSLAATLVSLFSIENGIVLDPFSGCGTVPFEAALQGRNSIGSDVSPLASMLTAAKIRPPGEAEVFSIFDEISRRIESFRNSVNITEMEPEIREFYHEKTAGEILIARAYLRELTDNFRTNDAGLFLASCLVHLLHGNRPYALSRRSHNIIPIPPKGETKYRSLTKSLREKLDRALGFSMPANFKAGSSFRCSVDNLPLSDSTVDTIITSPPFLGTTHFLRQNRIRLWFTGWDYQMQNVHRTDFVEHDRGPERYAPVLIELRRVLRPRGLMIWHIGIVKNQNMADMLAPFFLQAGFSERGRVWEDASSLETHGRTDRGGTHTHGFVILQRD